MCNSRKLSEAATSTAFRSRLPADYGGEEMEHVFGRDERPNASERHQPLLDDGQRVFPGETGERLPSEKVEDEEKDEAEANPRRQHELQERARLEAEVVASMLVVRLQLQVDLRGEDESRSVVGSVHRRGVKGESVEWAGGKEERGDGIERGE